MLSRLEPHDDARSLKWVAEKLVSLRVFPEADKSFHLDVREIQGSLLLVSNFTVAARTAKGRRPSFDSAMPPEQARDIFEQFVKTVKETGVPVQTGRFAADMNVSIENEGPATFLVRSE